MIKSGIFDSNTATLTSNGLVRGDKAVDAAYLSALLSSLVTNGILMHVGEGFRSHATGAEAGEEGAMNVITESGALMIDGHFAYDTARETRTFVTSTADRCAVRLYRLNVTNGTLQAQWRDCLRQGNEFVTVLENQVLPVRNGEIYDLVTTVVDIPAGAQAITDEMITDLRKDTSYCGAAMSALR